MTTQLRPYQQEAIDATFAYWAKGGGNPLIEMATGTGKSVVVAGIARRVLEPWPEGRAVMLVHVQELVEQNFMAIRRYWPGAPVGIVSAGLGRRDYHHRLVCASIQTVARKPDLLGPRDLVMIDEAHLTPREGNGQYRSLLERLRDKRPDMRVIGFTATPYRLGTGRLDHGDDRLFDETVYTYGIRQGIEDGFLSPLISKASAVEIDVSSIARRGGEFVPGALEAASDKEEITRAAVAEIMALGADRRSWLVFCAGVKHAHHVRDEFRAQGISCETITGDTDSGARARIIAQFKSGAIRCLTNAQVLTTGFDAPGVDLVAMLRPTLSTGLYVQIVGRGTRLAEGKDNCLILDFAGNVRRHGPVDAIEVREPKKKGKKGDQEGAAKVDDVRAKECPSCKNLVVLNVRSCQHCGHEFPAADSPKHEAEADAETTITTLEAVKPREIPVINWYVRRHTKPGSPDSMRVTYLAGVKTYDEWVCVEHFGPARNMAERWFRAHGVTAPKTVDDAMRLFTTLSMPTHISVKPDGKYWRVVSWRAAMKEAAE